MGINLEDVLAKVVDGGKVDITIVSNQDTGLASYALGFLVFHGATGGQVVGGPPFHPSHMESDATHPLKMFFSDRNLNIDPPPAQGSLPGSPRQPFSANAIEVLNVLISPITDNNQTITITISVFGNRSTFDMERLGNLYVGAGPPLGPSPEAVYALAFTGVHAL